MRVEESEFDWASSSGVAAGVRRIVEEATREDGQSPLDEQVLLSLRHHGLSSATLWISLRHRYVNRDAYVTVDVPMSEGDPQGGRGQAVVAQGKQNLLVEGALSVLPGGLLDDPTYARRDTRRRPPLELGLLDPHGYAVGPGDPGWYGWNGLVGHARQPISLNPPTRLALRV